MSWVTYGLCVVVVLLIILVIYQHLIQRAALRIGEILYVMAGNVRAKATEVRRDGKDVEIIEAHLFDIATSGRSEESLGPDPSLTVFTNGSSRMSADSLLRLTDNIYFSVSEEQPDADPEDVQNAALERFLKKVPNMDAEAARKIVNVVAHQSRKDSRQPSFAQAHA